MCVGQQAPELWLPDCLGWMLVILTEVDVYAFALFVCVNANGGSPMVCCTDTVKSRVDGVRVSGGI